MSTMRVWAYGREGQLIKANRGAALGVDFRGREEANKGWRLFGGDRYLLVAGAASGKGEKKENNRRTSNKGAASV